MLLQSSIYIENRSAMNEEKEGFRMPFELKFIVYYFHNVSPKFTDKKLYLVEKQTCIIFLKFHCSSFNLKQS